VSAQLFGELSGFTALFDEVLRRFRDAGDLQRRRGSETRKISPLVAAAVYGRVHRRCQGQLELCWESAGQIGKSLGVNRVTIQDCLRALVDAGYILDCGEHPRAQTRIYSVKPVEAVEVAKRVQQADDLVPVVSDYRYRWSTTTPPPVVSDYTKKESLEETNEETRHGPDDGPSFRRPVRRNSQNFASQVSKLCAPTSKQKAEEAVRELRKQRCTIDDVGAWLASEDYQLQSRIWKRKAPHPIQLVEFVPHWKGRQEAGDDGRL